ncbi:MAG: hypothetical protein O7157_00510 [Wolbachia endosymbiont of Tetragnatha montana]|nr:hypothetical protein [Wolbachia endosymbiont of Tetragnatha montana]
MTLPRWYELGIAWLEAREDNHFSEWISGRLLRHFLFLYKVYERRPRYSDSATGEAHKM